MSALETIGLLAIIFIGVGVLLSGVYFVIEIHETNRRVREMYVKSLEGKRR